jgi:hypothetical protein
MSIRPRDLAEKMSTRRELDGSLSPSTFRLPLEAARRKARQIINEGSRNDSTACIERWRQLPDGQVEFSVRRLRVAQQD